jgi:hypothetical protein
MNVQKWILLVAVVFAFLGSGVVTAADAEKGARNPAAESAAKKKKKTAKEARASSKSKGKAKRASARAKDKGKKVAKGKGKAKAKRAAAAPKSHYPAQPENFEDASASGAPAELSNEKKDDLPAPMNTEPAED